MNALTYSFCGKPAIGLVMFMTGLCVFPNPVRQLPISLGDAGAVAHVEFDAPVTKPYELELVFGYTEGNFPQARSFVGESGGASCSMRYASRETVSTNASFTGIATPFEVTIQSATNSAIVEHFFLSGSCGASWYAKGEIGRTLTAINLKEGKYRLIVKNLNAHEPLKSMAMSISLSPGSTK